MRGFTFLLFATFWLSDSAHADCEPGAVGIVTQALVSRTKETTMKWLSAWLPHQRFEAALFHQFGIQITDPHGIAILPGFDLKLEFQEPPDSTSGGVVHIDGHFDVEGKADIKFFNCRSTVKFVVRAIRVAAAATFSLTAQGELALQTLGAPDVDFKGFGVSGGCGVPVVLDWLEKNIYLVKQMIRNSVNSHVAFAIEQVVTLGHHFLHKFSYQTTLPLANPFGSTVLDFHLCSLSVRGNGPGAFIDIGFSGDARDASMPNVSFREDTQPLPAMGHRALAAGNMANLEFGSFSVDSLLYVWYRQAVLHYTVHRNELPEGPARKVLSTDFYRFILPKLTRAYPHKSMQITLNVSSVPRSKFKDRDVEVTADLDFIFAVACDDKSSSCEPEPVFALTCPATLGASLMVANAIGPAKLQAILDKVTDCKIDFKWSEVGEGSLGALTVLERGASSLLKAELIPMANSHLAHGLEVPSIEIEDSDKFVNISIENASVFQREGCFLISTNATGYVTNVTNTTIADQIRRTNVLV